VERGNAGAVRQAAHRARQEADLAGRSRDPRQGVGGGAGGVSEEGRGAARSGGRAGAVGGDPSPATTRPACGGCSVLRLATSSHSARDRPWITAPSPPAFSRPAPTPSPHYAG